MLQQKLSEAAAEAVELLWRRVQSALALAGHNVVTLPERRTINEDWVVEGLHMPK